MDAIAIAALGLLAGIAVGWLIGRRFAQPSIDAAVGPLNERLAARDQQVSELRAEAAIANERRNELQSSLNEEIALRAAAEQRNTRIPELEAAQQRRERELDASRAAVQQSVARIAELEAQLTAQVRDSDDKLALLNEAQTKLSNAFKSLSAEALQNNNQSFLVLANAKLEKFQQGARDDLETRQKAIDAVIAPLKESLTSVDAQIRAMEQTRAEAS